MPKTLSALLLSLLFVVAAACSKKDPEPKLEGTWTVQSVESFSIGADGSVLNSSTAPPLVPTTYTFTASELTVTVGSQVMTTYNYTRNQSTLTLTMPPAPLPFEWPIEKLTKNTLALKQYSVISTGAGRPAAIFHLTR